ncbi:MAG: M20/M25/M40 family metallo-hydrolase [Syntrophaceae bacterium]|nr:M20/M25/M40 family metallo-hydrolase [Syntrophaceae bacterium]
MKERLAKLLEELSILDGLPGQEQPVVRYLKEKMELLAEEVRIGVNGNIYARKTGRKPGLTVLVSAHTDEIGLVVRDVDPSGMIRFDKLGWFSDSFLPGMRVRVGKIPGMVGIKSGHLMTEEEKRTVLPHRNLYIDVGARSAAEVENMGISIGDPIAFDVPFGRWQDPDYCCGKAIDNRAACAVAVALLESLMDDNFPGTLWIAGTVQEERGLGGARTAAQFVRPDWFVALDVALAGDTPENPAGAKPVRLGGGVVISLGDFLESPKRGYFINPGLKEFALRVSREKSIPIQLQAIFGNSYTDAAAVSQEFAGIASISLGIPIRYSHAPSSVCHLGDMEACLRLSEEIIRAGIDQRAIDFLRG